MEFKIFENGICTFLKRKIIGPRFSLCCDIVDLKYIFKQHREEKLLSELA